MTIVGSGADFTSDFTASSSTSTIELPNDVVAGETIILGIRLFEQTTTVTSVEDPVNGTWSTGSGSNGPSDHSTATDIRTYFFFLNNSAALTGASNRTITVNLSASVTSALCIGVIADSGGAITFDEFATFTNIAPASTNHDTNSVTADGAGAIVGFHSPASGSSNPTADGTDEVRLFFDSGNRAGIFFEPYTGSGTKELEITVAFSMTGNVEVCAFLEPVGDVLMAQVWM